MTKGHSIFSGEDLSDAELDTLLDGGFSRIVENANICRLDEIDISKPGWEVTLHFDDQDPQKDGSQAAADYWKLDQWVALGMFQMDYRRAPTVVIILKYDANCGSDRFSADQIALFEKYRPLASCPKTSRRLAEDEEYVTVNPGDDGVSILVGKDPLDTMFELEFEVLALTLSGTAVEQQISLSKLRKLVSEEELVMKIDDNYVSTVVYITKKDGVLYQDHLSEENFQFLKGFVFDLI